MLVSGDEAGVGVVLGFGGGWGWGVPIVRRVHECLNKGSKVIRTDISR